jgi:hypothetical protein
MDVDKEVQVNRLKVTDVRGLKQGNLVLRTVTTFGNGAAWCFSVMAFAAVVLFFISMVHRFPIAGSLCCLAFAVIVCGVFWWLTPGSSARPPSFLGRHRTRGTPSDRVEI